MSKPLVSNHWTINLGKLVILEDFIDTNFVKVPIKAYNPANHSFIKKDQRVLYTLEIETFIEAFDLGGPLVVEIDFEKLERTFQT